MLLKQFHGIEREEMPPNTSYEASMTQTRKSDKDRRKKEIHTRFL
jgi:hypothetical protein